MWQGSSCCGQERGLLQNNSVLEQNHRVEMDVVDDLKCANQSTYQCMDYSALAYA